MAYVISDDCISCGTCEGECPVGAILIQTHVQNVALALEFAQWKLLNKPDKNKKRLLSLFF